MASQFRKAAWAMTLVAGLSVAGAAVSRGQAQPQARPDRLTWEYRTVHINGNPGYESDEALNALGKQGWELVTVAVRGPYATLYVFKRPAGN